MIFLVFFLRLSDAFIYFSRECTALVSAPMLTFIYFFHVRATVFTFFLRLCDIFGFSSVAHIYILVFRSVSRILSTRQCDIF